MKKFNVFKCIESSEESSYKGMLVTLANPSEKSLLLMMPIDEEYAKIINFITKYENKTLEEIKKANLDKDIDANIISIYQTMINSWYSGNKYLSGIVIDLLYDDESDSNILNPWIIISDSEDFYVDSILEVSFHHAIMLSTMLNLEILITNDLLESILPGNNEDDIDDYEDEDHFLKNSDISKEKFPTDENILNIAKSILNKGEDKNDKEDKNKKDKK